MKKKVYTNQELTNAVQNIIYILDHHSEILYWVIKDQQKQIIELKRKIGIKD